MNASIYGLSFVCVGLLFIAGIQPNDHSSDYCTYYIGLFLHSLGFALLTISNAKFTEAVGKFRVPIQFILPTLGEVLYHVDVPVLVVWVGVLFRLEVQEMFVLLPLACITCGLVSCSAALFINGQLRRRLVKWYDTLESLGSGSTSNEHQGPEHDMTHA